MGKGILAALLLFAALPAWAGQEHVAAMAAMLSHLNHYPSPAEKARLRAIVQDEGSTANERVLARAMINMEHRVKGADAEAVRRVAQDAGASEAERTLAQVLLRLRHMPTAEDRQILQRLAGGG